MEQLTVTAPSQLNTVDFHLSNENRLNIVYNFSTENGSNTGVASDLSHYTNSDSSSSIHTNTIVHNATKATLLDEQIKKSQRLSSTLKTSYPITTRSRASYTASSSTGSKNTTPGAKNNGPPLRSYMTPMIGKRRFSSRSSELSFSDVLLEALELLKRKDKYEIFCYAVDVVAVPEYLDVIKAPMDFGSMEQKALQGRYKNFQEFEDDLALIFSNCKIFNHPTTIFYKQAVSVSQWWQRTRRAFKDKADLALDAERHNTSCNSRLALESNKSMLASSGSDLNKLDIKTSSSHNKQLKRHRLPYMNCRYNKSSSHNTMSWGSIGEILQNGGQQSILERLYRGYLYEGDVLAPICQQLKRRCKASRFTEMNEYFLENRKRPRYNDSTGDKSINNKSCSLKEEEEKNNKLNSLKYFDLVSTADDFFSKNHSNIFPYLRSFHTLMQFQRKIIRDRPSIDYGLREQQHLTPPSYQNFQSLQGGTPYYGERFPTTRTVTDSVFPSLYSAQQQQSRPISISNLNIGGSGTTNPNITSWLQHKQQQSNHPWTSLIHPIKSSSSSPYSTHNNNNNNTSPSLLNYTTPSTISDQQQQQQHLCNLTLSRPIDVSTSTAWKYTNTSSSWPSHSLSQKVVVPCSNLPITKRESPITSSLILQNNNTHQSSFSYQQPQQHYHNPFQSLKQINSIAQTSSSSTLLPINRSTQQENVSYPLKLCPPPSSSYCSPSSQFDNFDNNKINHTNSHNNLESSQLNFCYYNKEMPNSFSLHYNNNTYGSKCFASNSNSSTTEPVIMQQGGGGGSSGNNNSTSLQQLSNINTKSEFLEQSIPESRTSSLLQVNTHNNNNPLSSTQQSIRDGIHLSQQIVSDQQRIVVTPSSNNIINQHVLLNSVNNSFQENINNNNMHQQYQPMSPQQQSIKQQQVYCQFRTNDSSLRQNSNNTTSAVSSSQSPIISFNSQEAKQQLLTRIDSSNQMNSMSQRLEYLNNNNNQI